MKSKHTPESYQFEECDRYLSKSERFERPLTLRRIAFSNNPCVVNIMEIGTQPFLWVISSKMLDFLTPVGEENLS